MPCRVRLRAGAALVCGVALALAGGCCFGPKALELSHGKYNEAVRHVEEEELLRNLVHIRYNEAPLNLNVNSITAQYELTGQAEARPFFIAPNPSNSNVIFRTFTSILPDLMLGGSNRPTLALHPADDSDAVRQFLTPIPADILVFLSQTSWPVATVLRLWVERLNGVPNAASASGPRWDVVPDLARFLRVAELFQTVQDRGLASIHAEERDRVVGGPLPADAVTAAAAVEAAKNGLEYRPGEGGKTWVLVRKERHLVADVHPGAENSPEMAEVAQLLNLVPGQRRYDLVVARGVPDPSQFPGPPSAELRVETRSTSQVFFFLANGVEVPAEHLRCGVAQAAVDAEGKVFDNREVTQGLFAAHTCKGCCPPAHAYVAVKYRGYWYYLDDRDAASKATFDLVLQLSRLDFGHPRLGGGQGPQLTLPVGR
jgi:hypothetical protein